MGLLENAEFQLGLMYGRTEMLSEQKFRPLDPSDTAEVGAFFSLALQRSGVPGGSLALVEDGDVKLLHAGGVALAGTNVAISADARFRIASLTKPLSVAALSNLNEDEIPRLDASIVELFGSPRSAGLPVFPADLTLRDTLCACAGLLRRDAPLVFRGAPGIPRDLSDLEIRAERRPGVFGYSSQAFSLGMYAVIAARGADDPVAAFPGFMQDLLFDPLSMSATSLVDPTGTLGERAQGHALNSENEYVPVSDAVHAGLSAVIPAAGGWSTAEDMGEFLASEVRRRSSSEALRPANELLREQRQLHVFSSFGTGYGLGWYIDYMEGVRIIHHRGSAEGYSSDLIIFPEQRAGLVVLLNAGDASAVTEALRRKLTSLWFDTADDSMDLLESRLAGRTRDAAENRSESAPVPPSVALDMAGAYSNPGLGEITVRRAGSSVFVASESWESQVAFVPVDVDSAPAFVFLDPPLAGQRLEIAGAGVLRYATYYFVRTEQAVLPAPGVAR